MRVVESMCSSSSLGKPRASALKSLAHSSVSTLLYFSMERSSSGVKSFRCLPLVLVDTRSSLTPTPSSRDRFLSETPQVLPYLLRAMAAVQPHILGRMPNLQAMIMASKPDMLCPMAILVDQSSASRWRLISLSPKITSVGASPTLMATEMISVSGCMTYSVGDIFESVWSLDQYVSKSM